MVEIAQRQRSSALTGEWIRSELIRAKLSQQENSISEPHPTGRVIFPLLFPGLVLMLSRSSLRVGRLISLPSEAVMGLSSMTLHTVVTQPVRYLVCN